MTKTDEENLAQNNQIISETTENTTENQAIIDIDDTTKAIETGIILLINQVAAEFFVKKNQESLILAHLKFFLSIHCNP